MEDLFLRAEDKEFLPTPIFLSNASTDVFSFSMINIERS